MNSFQGQYDRIADKWVDCYARINKLRGNRKHLRKIRSYRKEATRLMRKAIDWCIKHDYKPV